LRCKLLAEHLRQPGASSQYSQTGKTKHRSERSGLEQLFSVKGESAADTGQPKIPSALIEFQRPRPSRSPVRADDHIVNERPGHGHARNEKRVNARTHPAENDREQRIDPQADCVYPAQAAPIESAFD